MQDKLKLFNEYRSYALWYEATAGKPFHKRLVIKLLRSMLLLMKNLQSSRIHLWASALTYYSTLALVPFLAFIYAITRGFGLNERLCSFIERTIQNPDASAYLINMAENAIEQTKMSVIAGAGVIVLLFSVVKMVGNIEKSFNFIWGVSEVRPWLQRVSYYISVLLICPVLLITAGSATAMFARIITPVADMLSARPVAELLIKLAPLFIVVMLLTLIYKLLPNTKVKFTAALSGAVVAGVLYQILQIGYFFIQSRLTSYNAIYGSLSFLPLFLIYLHLSWMIVLFGTQISYLAQNLDNVDAVAGGTTLSVRFRRRYSLAITAITLQRYLAQEQLPTATEFARKFRLPSRIINQLLTTLTISGILAELPDDNEVIHYMPLMPPDEMTVMGVLRKLESRGKSEPPEPELAELTKMDGILTELERIAEKSVSNVSVKELIEG